MSAQNNQSNQFGQSNTFGQSVQTNNRSEWDDSDDELDVIGDANLPDNDEFKLSGIICFYCNTSIQGNDINQATQYLQQHLLNCQYKPNVSYFREYEPSENNKIIFERK